MSLGTNICEYRKKAGLTQEALAKKICVTNQAVSKWETDICFPDTAYLPKLADALDVSIDALFGRQLAITWHSETEIQIQLFDKETEKMNPYPGTADGFFSYKRFAESDCGKDILKLAKLLNENENGFNVLEIAKFLNENETV